MKLPLTILFFTTVLIKYASLSNKNLGFLDDGDVSINTQVGAENYDTLILGLSYLPTLCKIEEKNSSQCLSKISSLRTQKNFTIHGLWPYSSSDELICKGKIITVTLLPTYKDLNEDMNNYWPSIKGSNTNFWVHEYNKHGECFSKTHINYFQTTINLYKSLDIQNMIHSLFPGTSKKVERTFNELNADIKNFLKGDYHKIYCLSDDKGVQYLKEIRINFDSKLKLKRTPKGGNCFFSKPITILFL